MNQEGGDAYHKNSRDKEAAGQIEEVTEKQDAEM
jgi:hypothetical protein